MKRVLVIDDNPAVRRKLVRHLAKPGVAVEQAASGAHGLERIERDGFDLVLLDLAAPGMDGLAVLRKLRAAGRDVPVVMFASASSRPESKREATSLGVEDFISKPLRAHEISAIVDRALTRPRAGARGQGEAESDDLVTAVVDYMGGDKVFRGAIVRSRSDAHDLIVHGLPAAALGHVVAAARVLLPQEVGDAVGVSLRTVQRRRDAPRKPLSREQGDRAWQFAELMVRAIGIFGSREDAEQWFRLPAMALDQKRPIDLVTSSIGAKMVEQLLTRIEYGVYT